GPPHPLPDAQRARGGTRRDLRAGAGLARAERGSPVGARDGRGARARPRGRRLEPAPPARGRGRLVHPAPPRRADAGMSASVTGDVARILDDVRERGDAALAEWALRFDGVEPYRAESEGAIPEKAVLALAQAVRRWHALQRPA